MISLERWKEKKLSHYRPGQALTGAEG